ncbi:transglycosylase SLT domain-containing protein [Burkholderia vietnamiensis]|uniref:Lytic transglycosylase, catalytic n=1 Tax=Burkholderia vietnamiensis (strain G4 / LMG 22486) TaxID=269482 RepID=A4JD42_BURVG|nr:transglycosylase SLT domain-containing protein [Burkholderia vietnamiensis]ABO54195.1 Lytic transglycosylase, catalytic [Burkholderia vietnamiensis G4]MCB4347327.1 transglycosylase SLT domain-containing protein [Burkholderia vietnamiensis]
MANYDPIIQEAAQKYNVDPALIRGVIATESAGNPNAASGVGATGLMQIMPSNYKALGITDPKDPTQNIMGGTKLLSQLLDRFGDPVTALRHYQGGDDQTKWGPVNAAYPSKVLAAGGISMPSKQTTPTLPGIPTSQPSAAQSDDQIFAAFAKGAAPAQGGQGVQSDDAIFAALMKQPVQTAAPPAAQAAPQAPQPAQAPGNQPGAVMSFLAGLGHGVQETALGAQQLLGHGAQAVGLNNVGNWLVNDANQGLARGNAEYAPYQAAHPIAAGAGNIGGSIAATAPLGVLAPTARTLGGMAAVGAGLGGATAALSPVDPNSQNFAADKAKQIGIGALTGGVLSPAAGAVGRMISPNISPDVQLLMSKGVTPTPGQILGGGFARTEDKLTSIPVLGDMIKNAQQRAVGQFNVAAYNDALAPIGKTFSGSAGQEGIEQVGKTIGKAYDDVLPKMQMRVDPQFQADVTNLGQMVQGLPEAQQKTFMNVLKTQIFDKLGPQGNMDGQTLKGVQSELARTSSGYLKDPSFDNRQFGAAVSALRDAVDSNLSRVNPPELAEQLSNANQAWANFVRLRSAASSAGAMNNGGVFTGAQLQSAVRGADKSVGKGATASGKALMQDLSGAGQAVLGSKYPDSGTVGRGLMSLLAPGSVAAGMATAPTSTLATLGGIGLGSLPYTQTGGKLAAALLTARPQFAQPVGNAVSSLGRLVVPGSLPALLSGSR